MTITSDSVADLVYDKTMGKRLSTKETQILKELDSLKKSFSENLADLIYLSNEQTKWYNGAKIQVAHRLGRSVVEITFPNGDWFTVSGNYETKSNFGFQGCHLENTNFSQCSNFVIIFSRNANKLLQKAR